VNGGWLPPGLAPSGGAPTPIPADACAIPDPFAGIPGLVGICLNDGWVATEALDSSATMRFHSEGGGFWALHLDDGRVFVPMVPVDPVFQVEGLRVVFTGKVRSDMVPAQGTIVEIITIAFE
jgi:hypothetical protein